MAGTTTVTSPWGELPNGSKSSTANQISAAASATDEETIRPEPRMAGPLVPAGSSAGRLAGARAGREAGSTPARLARPATRYALAVADPARSRGALDVVLAGLVARGSSSSSLRRRRSPLSGGDGRARAVARRRPAGSASLGRGSASGCGAGSVRRGREPARPGRPGRRSRSRRAASRSSAVRSLLSATGAPGGGAGQPAVQQVSGRAGVLIGPPPIRSARRVVKRSS